MKVAYDYQIFYYQEYGGISRYFFELADRMTKYPEFEVKILAPFYINKYLKKQSLSTVVGFPIPSIATKLKIWNLVNFAVMRSIINRYPPDILHETFYSEYKFDKIKTVITMYDLTPEKFEDIMGKSEQHVFKRRKAIMKADHIIAISHNTKKDLMELYGIDSSKITVVHLGYSLSASRYKTDKPIVNQPYIFFVGQRHTYKNFSRLLQAYARSERLKRGFQLVCFGGGSFTQREIHEIWQLGLGESQVVQFFGDDEVLANLYSHAAALVYPSLYEGFGLPLLEAMSYKCPVICSNRSSFPEVAGEAAEYFVPEDSDSIGAAIEKVLYSPGNIKKLISLGLQRIKEFSWEKCADNTRAVYLSLN